MVAINDMEGSAQKTHDLKQVLEQFLAARINVEVLLASVSSALEDDLNCADDLQEKLDDALRAGMLPEQVWERITAEIDQAISEDEPTEWSEDSSVTPSKRQGRPNASDVYPASAIPLPVSAPPAVPDNPVYAAQAKPPAGPMEPGKLLGDRYVIVSRAKTGGMGDIYKALDRRKKDSGAPDPWVAIKILGEDFAGHPQALASMESEAAQSRKLDHQNVVRVFDFDHSGERCFITMEWLEGESLVDIMDRAPQQPLPEAQARQIIQGLGAALLHTHERGVVHADIKPGNVFVDHKGEAKLLDFGIARAAAAIHDVSELNALTPAFCSCEVLEGQAATPLDDLFSFGLLAYRALAGKRAFGRVTAIEAETGGCEPERVDSLNDNEWQALKAALAFRREGRPPDVASFLAAFNEPVAGSPEPADSSSPMQTQGSQTDLGPDNPAMQTSPTELRPEGPEALTTSTDLSPDDPAALTTGSSPLVEAASPEYLPAQARPGRFRKVALRATPLLLLGVAAVFWLSGEEAPDPALVTRPSPETRPPSSVAPTSAIPPRGVSSETTTGNRTAGSSASETAAADKGDTPIDRSLDRAAREPDATRISTEGPGATGEPPTPDTSTELLATVPAPQVQLASNNAAQAISPVSGPAQAPASSQLVGFGVDTGGQTKETSGALADTPVAQALDTPAAGSMLASPDKAAAGELASMPATMGPPRPNPATLIPTTEYGPAPVPVPAGPRQVPMAELEFERFVEPRFPRRVGARRTNGWVKVEFLINQNGSTQDIRIVDSEPAEIFDQATVDAVEKWRFKPPTVGGVVEQVRSSVRLRFEPQR
ncbi:MAG: TonB family protein [Gammaproteobacteria bacterium]